MSSGWVWKCHRLYACDSTVIQGQWRLEAGAGDAAGNGGRIKNFGAWPALARTCPKKRLTRTMPNSTTSQLHTTKFTQKQQIIVIRQDFHNSGTPHSLQYGLGQR